MPFILYSSDWWLWIVIGPLKLFRNEFKLFWRWSREHDWHFKSQRCDLRDIWGSHSGADEGTLLLVCCASQCFGGACCLHIQGVAVEVGSEDGGSMLLWNTGNSLLVNTAQHPRRLESSSEFYSVRQIYSFKWFVKPLWQKMCWINNIMVISRHRDQEPVQCC